MLHDNVDCIPMVQTEDRLLDLVTSNETSISIKGEEFLNCKLLKKGSVPCNLLISQLTFDIYTQFTFIS